MAASAQPGNSSCFVSSKRPLGEAHQPIDVIVLTRKDLVSPFTVVLLEQLLEPGSPLVSDEHALVLTALRAKAEEFPTQSDSRIAGVELAFKEQNSLTVGRICAIGSTGPRNSPAEHGNISLMIKPGPPGDVYPHVSLQ
jgi:hypothetical protein